MKKNNNLSLKSELYHHGIALYLLETLHFSLQLIGFLFKVFALYAFIKIRSILISQAQQRIPRYCARVKRCLKRGTEKDEKGLKQGGRGGGKTWLCFRYMMQNCTQCNITLIGFSKYKFSISQSLSFLYYLWLKFALPLLPHLMGSTTFFLVLNYTKMYILLFNSREPNFPSPQPSSSLDFNLLNT